MGHYHIQTNKDDPGPALQWDYVIGAGPPVNESATHRNVQCRRENPSRLL